MSFHDILYDKENHIAWITLNRPQALNALSSQLWHELYQALEVAEKDKDVRVVVITGAGRAFSAGDDVKEVGSFKSLLEIRNFVLNFAARAVTKIVELPKPIIAAVNGLAYGGGCEIAMLSDLVIASESASFAVPEARIGAFPPVATTIGAYLMGKLQTSYMALTGEAITAKEAEHMGLVNKVVSAGELREAVKRIAQRIMLSPPTSVKAIKKALNRRFRREELEEAVMQLVALLETQEGKEGHRAFIEKRPPKWIAEDPTS